MCVGGLQQACVPAPGEAAHTLPAVWREAEAAPAPCASESLPTLTPLEGQLQKTQLGRRRRAGRSSQRSEQSGQQEGGQTASSRARRRLRSPPPAVTATSG